MFTNCGMTRKTRSIAIKDENNFIIKQWEFANATASDFTMTIPVKEMLAAQEKEKSPLKIFYYSPDHFTDGHQQTTKPESKKLVKTNEENHVAQKLAQAYLQSVH